MVAAAAPLVLGSAATAGAASTAGLFGAAGSFSLLQTASTLGTLFSIGSTLGAGSATNAQEKAQARIDELRARQETLRGQQEATKIKEDLAKSIATANARGAASGIDITSGSPDTAVREAINDANRAFSIAKDNAATNSETYRQSAAVGRERGKNAVRSSRASAVGLATSFIGQQYDRGARF